MTWSSAHIEEKEETNAKYVIMFIQFDYMILLMFYQRKTQPNKIRGLSSYNGVSPGKIHISVSVFNFVDS